MILVIDNYDSFTWNLVHYLMELGQDVQVVRNDALTARDALASNAEAFLISPGPCTPNEAGVSLDLVAAAAEAGRPLLGVCLGHQAIGQHFGGHVVRGGLMHGKTSAITHDGTGLFKDVPSPFQATRMRPGSAPRDTSPGASARSAQRRVPPSTTGTSGGSTCGRLLGAGGDWQPATSSATAHPTRPTPTTLTPSVGAAGRSPSRG